MISPLLLDNGTAYCLQLAVVAGAGLLAPHLAGLRSPRPLHRYLQLILLACLLLPAVQPWRQRVVSAEVSATIAAIPEHAGGSTAAPAAGVRPLAWTGAALYAAGVLARLLWLGLGLRRLAGLRRRALKIGTPPDPVAGLARRLGVRTGFYRSGEVPGPVTFGFLRPVVLLPPAFFRMTPESQLSVACHELLHVRRRDWLWAFAEEFVKAVFWFHPVMLWLVARIRSTREEVVDRAVVEWTGARRTYVEALLEMAGASPLPCPGASMFAERSHLTHRVSLLLKEVPMPRHHAVALVCLITAVAALAGVVAVRSFPLETAVLAAGGPSAAASPVYVTGGGVLAPQLLSKVEPQYSPEALERKVQGTVVVLAEIWPDGRPHNLRVEKSLDPSLDRQALEAIRSWRFKPGTKDGVPVKVRARLEINFRLKDDSPAPSAGSSPAPPGSAPAPEASAGPPRHSGNPEGMVKPVLLNKVEPEYTEQARQAGIAGTAVVKIEISPEGHVDNAEIVKSLDAGLDQKALEAVRQWRFLPATRNAQPVRTAATVEIVFRLD